MTGSAFSFAGTNAEGLLPEKSAAEYFFLGGERMSDDGADLRCPGSHSSAARVR